MRGCELKLEIYVVRGDSLSMLAHKLDLLPRVSSFGFWGLRSGLVQKEWHSAGLDDFGEEADGRHEGVVLPSVWLMIDGSGVAGVIFLGRPQGEAIDADGDAVVFEPVEEGVNQGFSSEEIVPVAVVEVRCDNG